MDEKTQQIMFSSENDNWTTPDDFYQKLDNKYHFTLDPAATAWNAKCKKFFTVQDDGLKQSWAGETVFVNPPYSQIKDWVKKAYEEAEQDFNTTVVLLIPSRTDTKYWHQYVMKSAEIHFIKGRLRFGGGKNCAPFPSAVIVFRRNRMWEPEVFSMEK